MESEKNQAEVVWRERIARQQGSGESIKAWCRANGCREHSFYWWRSRLGLSPRPPRVRRRKAGMVLSEIVIGKPARPLVAELIEPAAASIAEPIRLRLLGGRELVLPASMSDQRVAALIGLIEGHGSVIGGGCDSK
jgi:hypothetical protein